MNKRILVEIKGRNDFWQNALQVEWDYQFPDRKLLADASGFFAAEELWFADLERVAAECFCEVRPAPRDPGRRQLFRRLIGA